MLDRHLSWTNAGRHPRPFLDSAESPVNNFGPPVKRRFRFAAIHRRM
jgi:hypothetical protein